VAQVSEQDLRSAFAAAGFLWELTLPRGADGKARGFAFVGYTCRAHAERGIRLVNGQQVAGRPVAVDWAVSKSQFDAAAKQAAQPGGEGARALGRLFS
jgi:nucleolar protein 4